MLHMMLNKKGSLLLSVFVLLGMSHVRAQTAPGYSLQQLINSANHNSHLLSIREYQVQEKMSKLKEDKVKRYPSVTLDGSYQYNFMLPQISIPAGKIGSVTTAAGATQLLPSEASKFTIGSKSTYNIGLNVYQPITQQLKLKTGLSIDETEIMLSKKEKEKTALQLQLGVEQLYYGAIITQKQTAAAKAKLELAHARIYDIQGSLLAGKTTGISLAGLRAEIAAQDQNILKLDIQTQDYLGELARLTGLDAETLKLQEPELTNTTINSVETYKNAASENPDMEIARLNKWKAMLALKAAKQNNLPDFGVVAGYYAQQGSPVVPGNSPYVGLSLKWNIQDLFSNKELQNQRQFQLKQAEENIAYTQRQMDSDVEKAIRKVKQSAALIAVSEKLVSFRKEALKEQRDKQASGLDIKTAMLETLSQLADAETDLYSAQLSNVLAIAELRNLTGQVK